MRIPKHIAIIPDGNRRWATQHQMEKKDGYQHGLNPRLEIGIADIKVNFLVNYGWEWDLSAIRKKGMEQENDVMTQIHSKDISRIDLVIRWGNMRRLSGMLPVQSVYADFYVVENLWPDYKERDFDKAIRWYDKQDVTLGG